MNKPGESNLYSLCIFQIKTAIDEMKPISAPLGDFIKGRRSKRHEEEGEEKKKGRLQVTLLVRFSQINSLLPGRDLDVRRGGSGQKERTGYKC